MEIFMEKSFEKSLPIFPGKFHGNFPEKVIFRGKKCTRNQPQAL
jgi:hypothetical protein